jgi:hypothetical protein
LTCRLKIKAPLFIPHIADEVLINGTTSKNLQILTKQVGVRLADVRLEKKFDFISSVHFKIFS